MSSLLFSLRKIFPRHNTRALSAVFVSLIFFGISQVTFAQNSEWDQINQQTAGYMQNRQFDQARASAQSGLALAERTRGKVHAEVAASLNNIAIIERASGHPAEALPLLERALGVCDKLPGNEVLMLQTLNNLGLINMDLRNYPQAEQWFKRALSFREKKIGSDSPDLIENLNNLAVLYKNSQRFSEAEPYYQRALQLAEKRLGADHPSVPVLLSNLGLLYYTQGKFSQAETPYRRAINIWEIGLGADHPTVLQAQASLAAIYLIEGKTAQAEPLVQHALPTARKALGEQHPLVGDLYNELGEIQLAAGDLSAAELSFKNALAIRSKSTGSMRAELAQTQAELAEVYQRQNHVPQSLDLYRQARDTLVAQLGEAHSAVTAMGVKLGHAYFRAGEFASAEPLLARAYQQNPKDNSSEGQAVLKELAASERALGHSDRAAPLYRQLLNLQESTPDAVSHADDLIATLNALAWSEYALGQQDSALAHSERALNLQRRSHPQPDLKLIRAIHDLGLLNLRAGRYDAAERLLLEALNTREMLAGPQDSSLCSSLDALAQLYRKSGRNAEASQLEQRSELLAKHH